VAPGCKVYLGLPERIIGKR